ncbi:MAG TPA: NAD(P)H-binding protein [Niabella sp.]|nr:NAD(P)H-binding protein [Chitinophagaceae bacterium]HRN47892.1 NAD(P)H-binding protein [Niabella sp.]HUN04489.1 NAD(P)H-binding protein [Niabella sp.]
MTEKTATIIGATGMIGSLLLKLLLEDDYYDTVRILVRKPITITHKKLDVKLVNFDDYEWLRLSLEGSNAVFSCIGTTQKNVKGDKELYWKIDHNIPVKVCKIAKETGCRKFVMISSVGANSNSKNFYLNLKGKTEEDIIATGMEQIHIMQPSMLLGKRNESRPLESFAQKTIRPISKIMTGSMEKYRAIEGAHLAQAMIMASKKTAEGIFRYTYKEMMELAKTSF